MLVVRRIGFLLAVLLGVASAQEPGWVSPTYRPASEPGAQDADRGEGADPRDNLASARSEERGILDQLEDIDKQLLAVQAEQVALEEKVLQLDALRQENEKALAEVDETVKRYEATVSARLASIYRLHRQGLARVIFGAEDPADLRRRSNYLLLILKAHRERMDAFLQAVQQKREAMAAVERDVRALDALRTELAARATELTAQRDRRMELLEQIRSRRELTLKALGEMDAIDINQQVEARAGILRPEAGSPPPSPAPTPAPVPNSGGATFRGSHGQLPWPVAGTIERYDEKRGIDIQAEYGTPVRAVYEGTVKLADYVKGYGQTVVIEHGDYVTVYAHMGGIRVRRGQVVKAGDVLGLVGNTGLTQGQGYVLSFEIRYEGKPVDPRDWLQRR